MSVESIPALEILERLAKGNEVDIRASSRLGDWAPIVQGAQEAISRRSSGWTALDTAATQHGADGQKSLRRRPICVECFLALEILAKSCLKETVDIKVWHARCEPLERGSLGPRA